MSVARFGQNLFDIVIREAGNLEAIFDLVKYNQLEVDSDLMAGQTLTTVYSIENTTIKKYYSETGHIPNNADWPFQVWATPSGELWETPDGEVWEWL